MYDTVYSMHSIQFNIRLVAQTTTNDRSSSAASINLNTWIILTTFNLKMHFHLMNEKKKQSSNKEKEFSFGAPFFLMFLCFL